MYYDNANEYVGSTIQIHDYQLAMEQHYQCTKTYVKCAQFLTVNLSFLIITMTLSTWEISKISFYEPFSFWDSTDRSIQASLYAPRLFSFPTVTLHGYPNELMRTSTVFLLDSQGYPDELMRTSTIFLPDWIKGRPFTPALYDSQNILIATWAIRVLVKLFST